MPRRKGTATRRAPEFLADLHRSMIEVLVNDHEVDAARAESIASAVCRKQCHQWGKSLVYFPEGMSVNIAQRDWQIFNEFERFKGGSNAQDLAQKYDLSPQAVYAIYNMCLAEDHARRNGQLFPDQPSP